MEENFCLFKRKKSCFVESIIFVLYNPNVKAKKSHLFHCAFRECASSPLYVELESILRFFWNRKSKI